MEDSTLDRCVRLCRLNEVQARHVKADGATDKHIDYVEKRTGRTFKPRGRAQSRGRKGMTQRSGSRPAMDKIECDKCGYKHSKDNCPAKGRMCNHCKKVGHFYKMCRGRAGKGKVVHQVQMDDAHQR